eukprot:2171626-Rhodomonas_salina.3
MLPPGKLRYLLRVVYPFCGCPVLTRCTALPQHQAYRQRCTGPRHGPSTRTPWRRRQRRTRTRTLRIQGAQRARDTPFFVPPPWAGKRYPSCSTELTLSSTVET